jgi:hypothetical protein
VHVLRNRSWGLAALVAAIVLLWLQAGVARAAAIRYVATAAHGGNDNGGINDCSNQATPCLTIQNAIFHATNGDTIQIGPGIFATSVTSTVKALTFVGAGAGTLSAPFDPTTDTAIDAAATPDPAFTLGNHSTTFENLRIVGGSSPTAWGATSSRRSRRSAARDRF